jgi:hypothetical protein
MKKQERKHPRFIRAAVMAMQTGKLSEIIRIFEDDEYRKLVKLMPESLHKVTLESFRKRK